MRKTLLVILVFLFAGTFSTALGVVDRETLAFISDNPPIEEIVIKGNHHFSDGYIKDHMYSKIRTAWAALKGDRRSRIQRETMQRDTLEIRSMYLRAGFLGIQLRESFEPINAPDTAARVNVVIAEGRRFRYGEISTSGSYPEHFEKEFREYLKQFEYADPINYFDIVQTGFDLKTILANNGYPYATVESVVDTVKTEEIASVTYEIQSDSLTRFGDVFVGDMENYPKYVARREVKFDAGDKYSRQAILDSHRRLFESGYFTTLQLKQAEDQPDKYRPDFVLSVRERRPYYVTLTTGAGQSKAADLTWSVTGGTGKRNIFGSRRVDLFGLVEFALGSDRRVTDATARIRYTEPWFLGIRMPLSLTFEYKPKVRHEAQDFDVTEWNASISTRKSFGRYTEAVAGVEYQQVDIDGVPEELQEEVRNEVEGLSIRRRLYAQAYRDSRDHPFVPTNGSVRELRGEYYGGFLGGDENFYKIEGSWSIYRKVWPGWVSASRVLSGYADAFGDSRLVPSKDRLFLGGANTIRGFAENSLAPVRSDDLPGANFTVVVNQEFRWKTLQIFSVVPLVNRLFENLPLWQTVFFDMGNGFVEVDDFTFNRLAYSYGTGIQIISPAGPIRLDYARRIETDTIDYDYRWHFTILFAF